MERELTSDLIAKNSRLLCQWIDDNVLDLQFRCDVQHIAWVFEKSLMLGRPALVVCERCGGVCTDPALEGLDTPFDLSFRGSIESIDLLETLCYPCVTEALKNL